MNYFYNNIPTQGTTFLGIFSKQKNKPDEVLVFFMLPLQWLVTNWPKMENLQLL